MADLVCAHCGTSITDRSTMQHLGGESYCCVNCVAMASGKIPDAGAPRCAHCEMPIVVETTMVTREGRTFCCNNCAVATGAGAPHR
jgi:hypothetical protein